MTSRPHEVVTPHESPWTMTVPLVVLAFFAAVAGFINLPFSFTDPLARELAGPRHGSVRRPI